MAQSLPTDSSERAADNQRNLRRLVVSVQASLHRLNLLIAICDNPFYRDELIRTYEAELTAKGIACYQIQLDHQQPSLKQSLLDWQANIPDEQRKTPTLITVRGGDELLGVRLEQPKSAQERFFFSVQWTREGLREFQFPVVLWVTQAVAQGLAQQAPDFWSWRGGVFEFDQPMAWQVPNQPQSAERLKSTHQPESLADPAELEQQIAALQSEDPDSPLLESLYESLGETYYERLEWGIAADRLQETEKAVSAFQSAIACRESLNDPIRLATSLNYLASLYNLMGLYSKAEPLYKRSLQLRETYLGRDHLDTAISLNNLAELYRRMGRYNEAEPLYLSSLQICETQLGCDHPGTAASLNNLASLYELMRRYSEAEPLLVRALQIREARLGSEHPDTAASFNNLAGLYMSMGRYREAEPLLIRALQTCETQLGEQHPNTAASLNNLASLYESMEQYSKAEPLFKRSLQIHETQSGIGHPETAASLNNLASLYESMEHYSEAEPLYLRSLEILVKSLPEDHPYLQMTWDNFYYLIEQAVKSDRTQELSSHPITQSLLQEIQAQDE